MADKCLTRIENVLKKSSIATEKAQGILDDIKKAQSETKITDLDETITSKLADGVLKRQALQKKINKLNALEDEVKVRETVEYVLKEFPNDPVEGLTAVLVGSNLQKSGSRSSVAPGSSTNRSWWGGGASPPHIPPRIDSPVFSLNELFVPG